MDPENALRCDHGAQTSEKRRRHCRARLDRLDHGARAHRRRLDVIAIERGPWRDSPTDFPPNYMQDELRYRVRHELFLRPDQTTFTFRNKMDQTALPIRTWGAFMPPNGVGGGGVHWNAQTWRFLPTDFQLRTHLTQRYGPRFLP